MPKKLGGGSNEKVSFLAIKVPFLFFSVDLLGLLKWRSQKEKLPVILPALMKVSGQEIVKVI